MRVNFSGWHENRGKNRRSERDALDAEEMLRLHHYALSVSGLLELLPLLVAFMTVGETGLAGFDTFRVSAQVQGKNER